MNWIILYRVIQIINMFCLIFLFGWCNTNNINTWKIKQSAYWNYNNAIKNAIVTPIDIDNCVFNYAFKKDIYIYIYIYIYI